MKRIILGAALLLASPVALAWLLYRDGQWSRHGRNFGQRQRIVQDIIENDEAAAFTDWSRP